MNEPKVATQPEQLKLRKVRIPLSDNGGRIIVDCVKVLQGLPTDGPEVITRNLLNGVRGDIETSLGLNSGSSPKSLFRFEWTTLAYSLVVQVVETAIQFDPESPDDELRKTVLRVLEAANPVEQAKNFAADLEDAASATHGAPAKPSLGDGTP